MCSNMDGPGEYNTNSSQTKKTIVSLHLISEE